MCTTLKAPVHSDPGAWFLIIYFLYISVLYNCTIMDSIMDSVNIRSCFVEMNHAASEIPLTVLLQRARESSVALADEIERRTMQLTTPDQRLILRKFIRDADANMRFASFRLSVVIKVATALWTDEWMLDVQQSTLSPYTIRSVPSLVAEATFAQPLTRAQQVDSSTLHTHTVEHAVRLDNRFLPNLRVQRNVGTTFRTVFKCESAVGRAAMKNEATTLDATLKNESIAIECESENTSPEMTRDPMSDIKTENIYDDGVAATTRPAADSYIDAGIEKRSNYASHSDDGRQYGPRCFAHSQPQIIYVDVLPHHTRVEAFVDYNAPVSLIGVNFLDSAFQTDAVKKKDRGRRLTLPWKEHDQPYTYDTVALIPVVLASSVLIVHEFGVSSTLRDTIVLGNDFISNHRKHIRVDDARRDGYVTSKQNVTALAQLCSSNGIELKFDDNAKLSAKRRSARPKRTRNSCKKGRFR